MYDCGGCAVLALLPPLGRDGCASLALLPPLGCDGCAVLALLPHLGRGGCTNVRASARAPQTLSAREQRAANKEAGAVGVLCCVVQFTFFVLLCWSADLGRYSRCLTILLCLLWMMEQYRALSDVQIWLLQDCGNLLLCLLWMMEQYHALSDVQIWLLQDCGNLYQMMASR